MVRSQFRKGVLIATAVACTAALSWGVADWQRGAIGQESKISVSKSTPDHVAGPADKAAVNEAKSLSRAFRKAAEVVSPSVVTIQSKTKSKTQEVGQGERSLRTVQGNAVRTILQRSRPGRHGGLKQRVPAREGMGSGVIIDKSGIVLTNNHVVEGADEVIVQLGRRPRIQRRGHQDRRSNRPGRAAHQGGRQPAGRHAWRFGQLGNRRLGDCDRQSVRARTDGERRHHQRQGP